MDKFDEYLEELRKIHNKGPVEEQIREHKESLKRTVDRIRIKFPNHGKQKEFSNSSSSENVVNNNCV